MTGSNYTVGQLAKATDTKAVTIRYYEQQGLLPSATRTPAGYRLYTEVERDRLLFIRRSRGLGFSLDDVRELLGLADRKAHSCAAVDAKVEHQLAQVRERIRDLQGLENELTRLIACCQGGVIEECRIIESLSNRSVVNPMSADPV
ncbi:MerR family transcriptional regulator [Pseudomonas alkylphenolica]|uniref:MerR family transcriptional regulator n=1 Tax=Pseudomonas alkylphenolica TaxID=237609 RepID=A0A443ZHG7_9PSED|nr:helix-turn-helix domain-containing protein [Pseudomonas alkylphenolica]RWU18271.1 MerR family transcriptional regulator [Pseudomonas alkylphenolica]